MEVDVAVVGAGTAALAAGVAAAQAGATRVVLFEKAPRAESGGNSRFSTAGFRFWHRGAGEIREFLRWMPDDELSRLEVAEYSPEQFLADLREISGPHLDEKLCGVMVEASNEALHWLLDLGLEWEPRQPWRVPAGSNGDRDERLALLPARPIKARGGAEGGLRHLEAWRQIAARWGVEIRYQSEVVGLEGNRAEVSGLWVRDGNCSYHVSAKAVILCSGGYQASSTFRRRYLGPAAERMKVRGSRHDTGEVLQMALDLGAARGGELHGAYISPVAADGPSHEVGNLASRYSYAFGITVNANGERFVDEGELESAYTYGRMAWATLSQPRSLAYQLFDSEGIQFVDHAAYGSVEVTGFARLTDLARHIGCDPDVLDATIEAYNRAVADEVSFDPTRRDGRCAAGVVPPKSNWATRLDRPPFYAYAVTPGIGFAFGGLKVDEHGAVLSREGRSIERLYASGDLLGLFSGDTGAKGCGFLTGSGQTRNAVFSLLAGRDAVGRFA